MALKGPLRRGVVISLLTPSPELALYRLRYPTFFAFTGITLGEVSLGTTRSLM